MSITVKWGKERLSIPLQRHDLTLGEVRKALADYSHVPTSNFKLIYAGATMRDDNLPLSSYGIRDGSAIHMIGSAELPPSRKAPPPPKETPQRPTELDLIKKVQDEVNLVHLTLLPDLNTLLNELASLSPPTKELEREHLRLGELLLQTLLRLDGLLPEGGWEEARSKRKDAVREVQGYLDRLDDGWKEYKTQVVQN
ncbi:hypothetical protein M422DRAFT_777418 [Sphaerobolus stellatus SS14]|nr:hypothetical protein M422DRAFT_777418 [Sphaerobolus stellatus SS14]